jgi:hypothetical protein
MSMQQMNCLFTFVIPFMSDTLCTTLHAAVSLDAHAQFRTAQGLVKLIRRSETL